MIQVSNIKIKKPTIIKNVFTKEEHDKLKEFLQSYPRSSMDYAESMGRHLLTHSTINEYSEKLIPVARELFESEGLLPSYSLFSHYEGPTASLYRHIDDNACTYTIDLCLYQNEPWALGIQHDGIDQEYILNENEAVVYYGNDQEHWRPEFPNPGSQHVAMIFFHFVEPDHWYHIKGPDYVNVVRKQVTEEDWNKTHK
jgi:hypothetical protein